MYGDPPLKLYVAMTASRNGDAGLGHGGKLLALAVPVATTTTPTSVDHNLIISWGLDFYFLPQTTTAVYMLLASSAKNFSAKRWTSGSSPASANTRLSWTPGGRRSTPGRRSTHTYCDM